LARSDKSLWNLTMGFGFIVSVGLLFTDVLVPTFAQWSDYWRLYYPCAQALTHSGGFAEVYTLVAGLPKETDQYTHILEMLAVPDETFRDMPLILWALRPLSLFPVNASQAVWHVCSLVALSYATFVMARAAAILDLDAEDTHDVGWACISFTPVLLTLLLGQMGLVFGLLPLALGYWLLTKKRAAQAGLIWALLLLKPAFLIVALANAITQAFAKKFNCLIALVCGIGVISLLGMLSGGGAFQTWLSSIFAFNTQPTMDPRLDISFTHAMMSLLPADNQLNMPLTILMLSVGIMIAVGGFMQLHKLAQLPNKRQDLVPFATLVGASIVPIVVPHLPFYDLSVLAMAALVVYCMEWREHMEWRVHSITRMHWLCINAYFLLFLVKREFAFPIEVVALMLVFFMRMVETVRFAAHAPDG
jgi:hypothetical protein